MIVTMVIVDGEGLLSSLSRACANTAKKGCCRNEGGGGCGRPIPHGHGRCCHCGHGCCVPFLPPLPLWEG
jgi:hypothetical protein